MSVAEALGLIILRSLYVPNLIASRTLVLSSLLLQEESVALHTMCGITCVLALTPTPSPTTQRLASRSPANDHTNGVNGHHNPKKTNEHARAALFTELTASMKQIRHRGPDSEGQWISDDNRVGTLTSFTP